MYTKFQLNTFFTFSVLTLFYTMAESNVGRNLSYFIYTGSVKFFSQNSWFVFTRRIKCSNTL